MATSVEPESRGSISEHLSHLFPEAEDPVAIAGGLARVVQDIEGVLTPILGARGVAALYQRSLHQARLQHPWLADPVEVAHPTVDLAALNATFARQGHAEANAAAHALLQSFHDLLTSLIGNALTARLLDPVWARAPGGQAAKDIPE